MPDATKPTPEILPTHIAFIMDGNRRWASARGLPKLEGHRHGLETLRQIILALAARNVPVATFFAFSTENWKRTQEEVSWFLNLCREFLSSSESWFREHDVQLRLSGRIDDFPSDLAEALRDTALATVGHSRMIVNIALSYGGREEILHMVRRIARETRGDPDAINAINEETINQNLYTAGLPDVDLLIRTSGEQRLSGFLPWQSVYAELYFTNACWPDFTEEELDRALADFSKRKRNFGK